jgi:hypothetical protein
MGQCYPDRVDQITFRCRRGQLRALQRLFATPPTDETIRIDRYTLLHFVVNTPHTHILDWLLTFPLNADVRDPYGNTPLMCACFTQHEPMVLRLLAYGVSLDERDDMGYTALHWSCSRGWVEGVSRLLLYGADPNLRTRSGFLPEDCYWRGSATDFRAICDLLRAARETCGLK